MNTLKKLFFASLISLSGLSFGAVSLSGNIAVTTDYIWRGMTQNDSDPAVSGGFDLEDDSGFYIGLWASNAKAINTDSDGGTANDLNDDVISIGSLELDGYLGFAGSFNDDAGYDVGYIAYTYPGVKAWDFEEAYISFDFYGAYVSYAAGLGTDVYDYTEIGYSIDAGPGSFSVSYGDYDKKGSNYLVGYDWSVGDFTLGFYYSDFDSDEGTAKDEDGGYFTISY
tara:strand:+ start:528 stop:1202 length:675 start_codon:yes stop_codon:yes gene_type:complete